MILRAFLPDSGGFGGHIFSGTLFGKGGTRVIFQPFPAVLGRKEKDRFRASAVMMIFAVQYGTGVFQDEKSTPP